MQYCTKPSARSLICAIAGACRVHLAQTFPRNGPTNGEAVRIPVVSKFTPETTDHGSACQLTPKALAMGSLVNARTTMFRPCQRENTIDFCAGNLNPAGRSRESTILGCVGRKFMQEQCEVCHQRC